jgi:hypothetical protein
MPPHLSASIGRRKWLWALSDMQLRIWPMSFRGAFEDTDLHGTLPLIAAINRRHQSLPLIAASHHCIQPAMTPFTCTHCQNTVFFENSHCQACGLALGFSPAQGRMVSLDAALPGQAPRVCGNRSSHVACNWLLDEGDTNALCRSCRLSAVIPDLSQAQHWERWAAVERAKRRVLHTLLNLGLMPEPKQGPDDAMGLSFHILAQQDQQRVMTGHDEGVITINLSEADDVYRESQRVAFGEPWRTLLGHLRHELSHYLQHRWLAAAPVALQRWRESFGDERADYALAMRSYHEQGPAPDWATRCISAYASAHPHEDWAETCAHLLLMLDAVQTAQAWGLQLNSAVAHATPLAGQPLADEPIQALVLQHWLPVAQFLNAMNRSLGLPDSYPFAMPDAVVAKLVVAMALLRQARQAREGADAPMDTQTQSQSQSPMQLQPQPQTFSPAL